MEFKKARTAKEKQAISQGLKVFWDKEGRKDSKEDGLSGKQKLAIGIGGLALAGGGLALAAKKGKLPGFRQKLEPHASPKLLPSKASQARAKKGFRDYSVTPPKDRKKGQILPGLRKNGPDIVIQEPSPGLIRQTGGVRLAPGVKKYKPMETSRKEKLTNALKKTKSSLSNQTKKIKTKVEEYTPYAARALNTATDAAYVVNSAVRLKKALGFSRENLILEFRRAKTAEEKAKISRGLELYWDKEGRAREDTNKRLEVGQQLGMTGALAGLGLTAYAAGGKITDPKDFAAELDLREARNKVRNKAVDKSLDPIRAKLDTLYKRPDSDVINSLNSRAGVKPSKANSLKGTNLKKMYKGNRIAVGVLDKALGVPSAIRRAGRGLDKISKGRAGRLTIGTTLAGAAVGGLIAHNINKRMEKNK